MESETVKEENSKKLLTPKPPPRSRLTHTKKKLLVSEGFALPVIVLALNGLNKFIFYIWFPDLETLLHRK